MSDILALTGIAGAILLGAMSPGPSFVLVSRIALRSSRLNGLAAAIGMGVGGAIFATLALLGLIALLLRVELLYLGLRVLGGVYLLFLALRIWQGAAEPLDVEEVGSLSPTSPIRSFATGLLTQISNPKTSIVYAGIFAAFLPTATPGGLIFVLPPLVFMLETSWYAAVALVFSADRPRSAYLRAKFWVDRAAGALMGALGARLVSEAALSKQ